MSIQPGQHNISVQRRADYDLSLQFKDSNGTGINLTGWTAYAQVWDRTRTTKYSDFAITYTDRTTGQVSIALTNTQTATFPDEAFYDVLLEDSSGLRNYYLEGIVYVSEGYTAP
tara:strand:+ start:336 stop:677 length:342 start_codon:yes stop_codon:yes gene_type:complete